MAIIDENSEYAALAFNGTDAVPLKVDPVTERLLIEIHLVSETTSELNVAKIDENNESVSQCVDDNDIIRPLLIDSRNDYLFVDLLDESMAPVATGNPIGLLLSLTYQL